MKEYEYSIKVNDIAPYIAYCEGKGYTLIESCKQTRTLYRNPNKINARITTNEYKDKTTKYLDFKQDNRSDSLVKECEESLPLEFSDDAVINSILNILQYKKDNTLVRNRKTYEKDGVKFELDEYIKPYKRCVVAIEGEKQKVDIIYKEILKI